MKMLTFLSQRMRRDSHNLAATLRYTHVSGLDKIYVECSPQERLILDTINHKVAAATTLDAVMDFYFEAICKVGPCDRIGLAFLESGGGRVVSHWNRATYGPLLLAKGYAGDLRGSSLEPLLDTGAPRIIDDLEDYAREHPDSASTRLIVEEGIRSSITCPLIVEDRPVGFLFRSSRMPNAYDEHQVRIHYAVADRLGQAVEKAYRIEQLTAANQAYLEILGFVSHELKSPLASMVMSGDLLLNGYLGELEDRQREKIDRMMHQCKYLLGLVGDYLNLSRVEQGHLELRLRDDVDFLEEVVEPSIASVQPQIEDKGITFTRHLPSGPVTVQCAPELMQIVVTNLLSNAVKYGNKNGTVRLSVQREGSGLAVGVWNEGPGFPKEERANLFRKFSRLQTPELLQRKGTGVGLYTTWQIIQSHQGKIDAMSEHGSWAEFIFEIPQPIQRKTP